MKPQKISNLIQRVLELFRAMLLYDADSKASHILADVHSLYLPMLSAFISAWYQFTGSMTSRMDFSKDSSLSVARSKRFISSARASVESFSTEVASSLFSIENASSSPFTCLCASSLMLFRCVHISLICADVDFKSSCSFATYIVVVLINSQDIVIILTFFVNSLVKRNASVVP